MPIDLVGPLGAAQGQIIDIMTMKKQAAFQRDMKRIDQDFQRETYARQRADALADFHSTAKYNSPEQQMNRLRQAGLNPNLVYGKGADNTAAMARGSQGNLGSSSGMSGHINPRNIGMEAMTGANVQAQTDNLYTQAALTKAQTDNINMDTQMKAEEIVRKQTSFPEEQNKLRSEIKNIDANTTFTIDKNDREKITQATDQALATQKIATERQQVLESQMKVNRMKEENAKSEAERNNLAVEYNKMQAEIRHIEELIKLTKNEAAFKEGQDILASIGIMPNDPWYYRLMVLAGHNSVSDLKNIYNYLKSHNK